MQLAQKLLNILAAIMFDSYVMWYYQSDFKKYIDKIIWACIDLQSYLPLKPRNIDTIDIK